jgi:hypothetical protein
VGGEADGAHLANAISASVRRFAVRRLQTTLARGRASCHQSRAIAGSDCATSADVAARAS